jgi:lipid A 3-O-deacylase
MAKVLGLATALALMATLARAADVANAPSPADTPYGALAPFQPVEELRLGVFGDDAVHRERQAPMASIDVLSSPIVFYQTANPLLASLLAPRFEAGAMVNTFGLTSYAYAGLNWRTPKWGPVFAEFGFGGAVNDSSTNPHDMEHTDLGCPVTFRESAGIGWQLTERVDILASIEHISHANLCSNTNPGLTSVGLRVGYHF